MKSFKQFVKENEDYRGSHEAPGPHFGDPLHKVTHSIYPKDIYSSRGPHLYGDGGNHSHLDKLSHNVIMKAKDKPEHQVTIHRAVPKDAGDEINKGDWVSGSKDYAKGHGESVLGKGKYKILSKTVPAKHVWTNGDSLHEWGYHPHDENI